MQPDGMLVRILFKTIGYTRDEANGKTVPVRQTVIVSPLYYTIGRGMLSHSRFEYFVNFLCIFSFHRRLNRTAEPPMSAPAEAAPARKESARPPSFRRRAAAG